MNFEWQTFRLRALRADVRKLVYAENCARSLKCVLSSTMTRHPNKRRVIQAIFWTRMIIERNANVGGDASDYCKLRNWI